MATVLDEILDDFYERLAASEDIDAATIEKLRVLFCRCSTRGREGPPVLSDPVGTTS